MLQPLLGLYLVFGPHCPGPRMHGWLWRSLVLYLPGTLLTWIGYVVARSVRDLDRRHRSPSRIAARDFLANVLFLSGFLVTIAVLNLMITYRGTAG